MPAADKLEAGKERLLALLTGNEPITSPTAQLLIPFIAALATNALDSEEKIAAAREKLFELLQLRATSDGEKLSLKATVDLLVPPKPEGMTTEKEQMENNIDIAAIELLRSYFQDAVAKPSTDDLPPDVGQARAKLNALRPVRTPAAKRALIAHLLYHLDAHVGIAKEARDVWYRVFIPPEAAKEGEAPAAGFKMRSADEDLIESRIAWHQRVAAVVGLETYVAVVEAQATQLNQIQQQLQTRIREEQTSFEKEYQGRNRPVAHPGGRTRFGFGQPRKEEG